MKTNLTLFPIYGKIKITVILERGELMSKRAFNQKPFDKKEFQLRYKVKHDEEKRTLEYILKNNNIKYIDEKNNKLDIPDDYQIAYISPKGKIILAENTTGYSVHDEIANKIQNGCNKNHRKSVFQLISRGFVLFADISKIDKKCSVISYSNNNITTEQMKKLKEIKEKYDYEYMEESMSKSELNQIISKLNENEKDIEVAL